MSQTSFKEKVGIVECVQEAWNVDISVIVIVGSILVAVVTFWTYWLYTNNNNNNA